MRTLPSIRGLVLASAFVLAGLPAAALAQSQGLSLNLGSDLVSRYVWRGLSFGDSPSVQPKIEIGVGALKVGTWGNYALSADEGNAAEHDFWLSYTFDTKAGVFTASVVDYFYPGQESSFFDWEGDGAGSHTVEASLRYTVSPRLPLYAQAAYNVHNDPDGSWYGEVGYDTAVRGVAMNLSVGAARGASAWYGIDADEWALINVGVRLTRSIGVTERLSLPVQAGLVLNPHTEQTYLVFGLSL